MALKKERSILSCSSDFDISLIRKKVEANLFNQLSFIRQMEHPSSLTKILDISSPIWSGRPALIRDSMGLPPDKNQVIYLMRIAGQIKSAEEFKKLLSDRAESIKCDSEGFTRITGPTEMNEEVQIQRLDNVVLYVGTSKSFASRIKTHIGYGARDTATIFLRKWPALLSNQFAVTLDILDFGSVIESESLKLLEWEISNELRPLIGRNRRA